MGSVNNETIFNAARFLVNTLQEVHTEGVNKVYVYYALSFMATKFEAFKTARFGYDKLQTLKIPADWQEEIDVAALKVRSKPYSDKEDFQQIYHQCMYTASINLKGDYCPVSGHPYIRNCIGFDILPLVEFEPEASIPFQEVMQLIRSEPAMSSAGAKQAAPKPAAPGGDGWKEDMYGDA